MIKGDGREGELLLTQSHRNGRGGGISMTATSYSSASFSDEEEKGLREVKIQVEDSGGPPITNSFGHTLHQGRPDMAQALKRVFFACGSGNTVVVDVVVSGPEGMVAEVRRACAEHPLRARIRLRECSFEL